MKTISPTYILIAMLLTTNSSFAQTTTPQSVVNSTGSYTSTEKYQFEWSVGEMSSIQTIGVRSILISEGFLQPMTNNIFGVGYDSKLEFFNTKAFPIPAHNELFLQFRTPGYGTATISFKDALGRLISQQSIYLNGQTLEKVNISSLPGGQYYAVINYRVKGILTSRQDVFEITKQ